MSVPRRRLVLIRHNDHPATDRIVSFATTAGLEVETVKPFRGEALGTPDASVLGSVLYGGPFDADREDLFPFLLDEARWIRDCIAADVPLLGICQGAQQIARQLGAAVGPMPGEIGEFGCYRVDPLPGAAAFLPGPLHFANWHYHTFAIPDGAEALATSTLCPTQAFRYGRSTYGFQFHPEQTLETLAHWQAEGDPALTLRGGVQDRAETARLMRTHAAAQADWLTGFLTGFLGLEAPLSALPAVPSLPGTLPPEAPPPAEMAPGA